VDAYSDVAGLDARLVGRWFSCDYGSSADLYGRNRGIAFHADGTWSTLSVASDGTATELQGIDNQGTWAAQDPWNHWVDVRSGGDLISNFDFETGPRRMQVTVATEGAQLWFVPIP
jgi:hypothetical protein